MDLDTQSRLPLHVQIESALESTIADGTWQPGARLPSEDSLVERFGVSRTTIRTAIQRLVVHGLVEIRRGKGTFVVRPQVVQELTELTGFIEDLELGSESSARILDQRNVAASETVARQLGLVRGALLTRIQRVRSTDSGPLSFDETYLPEEIGDKTMTGDPPEQRYVDQLLEAEYRISVVAAHGTAARALGVDSGSPIFLIERTTYAEDFQPVYYERLYCRGDHIRFVTRLVRRQPAGSRGKAGSRGDARLRGNAG